MIEDIYQKQLEAILFSANQYCGDILSSWITKTETALDTHVGDSIPPAIENLLMLNSSIVNIFVTKNTDIKPGDARYFTLVEKKMDSLNLLITQTLAQNQMLVEQLLKYKRSGFQKLEVLPTQGEWLANFQVLIFLAGTTGENYRIAGFVIHPETFVEELVGPRLQMISKEQFILSVYNKNTQSSVYSTLTTDTVSLSTASFTKDFWIFPNYALGIRTQGASLKDIVRERTTTNLYLLIGLDIVLIVALVLVFRNVKKEVQLAQNKSDFVSNVSHEIRTPLALISMFAETLEMNRVPSEEKKREYYTIISKETQRLTGIVNKILNFSQVEAGKKELMIKTVELNREIKELLQTYDFHLRNKGFEYHFEETAPMRVHADRESLVEMIINLIDNAIKYSNDKKRIEITIGKADALAWVAVKDYGAGISRSDQKHIFDKFYRVPSGDLAKSQGTGLGLSYVKQLIEQQGGKITVESEPGQGSVFKLFFPLDLA